MKKLFLIISVILLAAACEVNDEKVTVRYEVSNAWSDTEISYRIGEEELMTEWVGFESGEDIWNYSLQLSRGDIVYLSAMYTDTASSVKIRILVDGKIFKEGSSNNEPDKYLTVSGTLPFN